MVPLARYLATREIRGLARNDRPHDRATKIRGSTMPHVDSGWRCLVYHSDHGPCVRCADCAQFIEPSKMGEDCPMPAAAQIETAEALMARLNRKDEIPI